MNVTAYFRCVLMVVVFLRCPRAFYPGKFMGHSFWPASVRFAV